MDRGIAKGLKETLGFMDMFAISIVVKILWMLTYVKNEKKKHFTLNM